MQIGIEKSVRLRYNRGKFMRRAFGAAFGRNDMKNKMTLRFAAFLLALIMLLCACTAAETPTTALPTTGSVPTQAPTDPAQAPTDPTQTPTEPTQAPTEPTQAPTDPTQAPTDPTQAPTEPTQAPTDPTEPAECTHTDDDNDGSCDTCGVCVTVRLDFYAVNDLHGVFMDSASNPGVDEMTTYFKNAFADDSAYEILLSSGDMWQGSVESSSNKGQLMTEWMNELGFVSMTLGNHEYDWGSEQIVENAALADFPFLAINANDENVEQMYCRPSVTVERGGVKIGIIGAVSNWLSSISGEFTDGLDFTTGSALTQMVKREATRLREEEGCAIVIYSIHEGTESSYSSVKDVDYLDYYDMELSDGYIDLVFEAHTHKNYVLRDSHGVYHIQAGGYNSALGYASVSYNTANGSVDVQTASTLSNSVYADKSLTGDAIVTELFEKYFPEEDPYTDVIGYNSSKRNSSTVADTVAQLYLEKGRALWPEYEIVLAGGFLKTRTPYDLAAGDVTYSQLYSLLPFDNDIVLCRITGRQLKKAFLESNNRNYHYVCDNDLAVEDDALYYIVTDTYTSFYKYNMFTEIARLEDYYARDLLRDYIAAGNWDAKAKAGAENERTARDVFSARCDALIEKRDRLLRTILRNGEYRRMFALKHAEISEN